MPILIWSDDLSVGIDSLDKQHKKWIELINQLFDAMKAGQARVALEPLLADVVSFARTHFATEEQHMTRTHYEAYAQHKLQHDKFLQQLDTLQKRQRSGDLALSIEVMKTLKDWIINHVQGVDKKYGPYLKSKGVI